MTQHMENCEHGLAAQKVYELAWSEFCDWYIELAKPRLYDEGGRQRETALYTLTYVLSNTLKLLHPFMPFITEEIWQHLPHEGESIMISPWPELDQDEVDLEAEEQMEAIMNAIRSIRNVRAEMDVPPSQKAQVIILPSEGYKDVFDKGKIYFERLAYASKVVIGEDEGDVPKNSVSAVSDKAQLFMPLEDLVDFNKEMERLRKESENLKKEIARASGKLANENFVKKAPPAVVEEERQKLERYHGMMEKVTERMEALKKMME